MSGEYNEPSAGDGDGGADFPEALQNSSCERRAMRCRASRAGRLGSRVSVRVLTSTNKGVRHVSYDSGSDRATRAHVGTSVVGERTGTCATGATRSREG